MTEMTFKEQIRSPQWQRRRLEIMQRDSFACQQCGDTETTLNVHHKHYVKGRMYWEYSDAELITLCEPCHEDFHEVNSAFKALGAQLPIDGPAGLSNAIALLAGWAHSQQGLELKSHFDDNPHSFATGEVARILEDKCSLDHLFNLFYALQNCPRWVVHHELPKFLAGLAANADMDPPQSYIDMGGL